jgi:hypothetical protein
VPSYKPSFFRSNNAIKFIPAPWGLILASAVLGDGKYGSWDYRYYRNRIFLFVMPVVLYIFLGVMYGPLEVQLVTSIASLF